MVLAFYIYISYILYVMLHSISRISNELVFTNPPLPHLQGMVQWVARSARRATAASWATDSQSHGLSRQSHAEKWRHLGICSVGAVAKQKNMEKTPRISSVLMGIYPNSRLLDWWWIEAIKGVFGGFYRFCVEFFNKILKLFTNPVENGSRVVNERCVPLLDCAAWLLKMSLQAQSVHTRPHQSYNFSVHFLIFDPSHFENSSHCHLNKYLGELLCFGYSQYMSRHTSRWGPCLGSRRMLWEVATKAQLLDEFLLSQTHMKLCFDVFCIVLLNWYMFLASDISSGCQMEGINM